MNKICRAIVALAAMIMAIFIPVTYGNAADNRIMEGIRIGEIDVSGMNPEEAKEALDVYVENILNTTLEVECVDGNMAEISVRDLGPVWSNEDVIEDALSYGRSGNIITRFKERADIKREGLRLPVRFDADKELIKQFVEDKCLKYNRDAVNTSLVKTESGFEVQEGLPGEVIDANEAADYLYDYLTTKMTNKDNYVLLPIKVDDVKGTDEDLALVKDLLGTFSTSYRTSDSDRSANVANGCRLVDGTLLYPGEEFSMYDHIKPFTEANGYRMAGSYLNGLVVDSLGGGICQVSTTLYNAVIRAELDIVERNNHSMIVGYVPASADAAIAESSGKDMRFVNSTDAPVYIEGYVTKDKQIVFNIYGHETRPENRKVDFESRVLETIPAGPDNIIASGQYPVGYCSVQSAHIGYKAELIKIVTVDGVEESREVFNKSNYKMVPRTAVVGVATDNPDAAAQIQAAIATGSIDQVKAMSDAWAAQLAALAAAAQAQQ